MHKRIAKELKRPTPVKLRMEILRMDKRVDKLEACARQMKHGNRHLR